MAPGEGVATAAAMVVVAADEGEGQAHVRRVTARSAEREAAGKKWTERDLDAPRGHDEDEALRCVTLPAAGATEKGARGGGSASWHRCLAVPCAMPVRVAPTRTRKRDGAGGGKSSPRVVVD